MNSATTASQQKTVTYLADGTKASDTTIENGAAKNSAKLGSLIYEFENNQEKFSVLTDGGMIVWNYSTGQKETLQYIKDHLGSVRIILQNGRPAAFNEYEPFGRFEQEYSYNKFQNVTLPASKNKFMFNGKEEMLGRDIGMLDFGARMYDPTIARWNAVEPKAEQFVNISPYTYCFNSPILYNDPNGETPRIYVVRGGLGHTFVSVGEGANIIVYTYGRYGAIYGSSSSNITSGNLTPTGEGILIRKTGEEALKYLQERADEGMTIFEIPDADDAKVAEFFDNKWFGTENRASAKKAQSDPDAKHIDEYNLFKNNCTTMSIEAINYGGGNIPVELWGWLQNIMPLAFLIKMKELEKTKSTTIRIYNAKNAQDFLRFIREDLNASPIAQPNQ